MTLTDTDRRRFMAATALTLLALPALWLANTSQNSTAPNLAVAGLDADAAVGASNAPTRAAGSDTAGGQIAGQAGGQAGGQIAGQAGGQAGGQVDGELAPVFLDGPSSAVGAGQVEVAVPARPLIDGITAKATFRSSVRGNTCIVPGVTGGSEVTVVNLSNNRSVDCTSVIAPATSRNEVVLPTSAFAAIADLTDAPISVEIRR